MRPAPRRARDTRPPVRAPGGRTRSVVAAVVALGLLVPQAVAAAAAAGSTAAAATAVPAAGHRPEPADAPGPFGSTTSLHLTPRVTVLGGPATAVVTVRAPGAVPGGTVEVRVDGRVVAAGGLRATGDGGAQVRARLPRDLAPGLHEVTATYAGGADVRGSTSATTTWRVLPGVPVVRTTGTVWGVGRNEPKVVRVHVAGVGAVPPTGAVEVRVNGSRPVTADLRADGTADVELPRSTRTGLVVVVYPGDGAYLPSVAAPRLLVVG